VNTSARLSVKNLIVLKTRRIKVIGSVEKIAVVHRSLA
jgi:hypothetical protein